MATAETQRNEVQPERTYRRRLPVGAEVQPEGGVHFRVFAPLRNEVRVVIEPDHGVTSEIHLLQRSGDGYHDGFVADAGPGTRYRFRLDELDGLFADPASRFQPDGCQGASEVIDPSAYEWRDGEWRGVRADRVRDR